MVSLGLRSLNRDLESQVFLLSNNNLLKQQFSEELNRLISNCRPLETGLDQAELFSSNLLADAASMFKGYL
jgi:hypothetical protein